MQRSAATAIAACRVLPLVVLLACLVGCSASVPPCNAIIWLFGAADLTLDCPATNAIKLIERTPPAQVKAP